MRTAGMERWGALVEQYDMLPRGERVLCAVSGGADSVCLLHLLREVGRRGGFTLAAAHFNHQLREEESDRDEEFVRKLCREWDIPLTVGRGDVKALAAREKRSLEEAARMARYAFLEETAEQEGCGRIATAHNAGDNAETVLLHLIRGCGLQGLTGMAPRRGKLVRPLLTTPRAEILDYLKERGIPYVEDSSNADERFERNRVRRQIIPALEELNPRFLEGLTETIPRLRADNELLDAQAAEISAQAERTPSGVQVSAAAIANAPEAAATRAVRQLLAQTAGGDTDCMGAHLEAVVRLCRGSDPSGQVHLPGTRTARRRYEMLEITTRTEPAPLEEFFPREGENPVAGTAWTVVVHGAPWPGLVVRPRAEGDALVLRNGHTRSLKKLCIDQKIPREERARLPVAADGDGVLAAAAFGENRGHPRCGAVEIIRNKREAEDGET